MRASEVICLRWADLKALIDRATLTAHWVESSDGFYHIRAQHGCLIAEAIIPITSPPNADQLEFETNYKV